jgi:plasmid rolling circle replication initiator protein Rep
MYDNDDDVEIVEGTGEILEDKSETGRIRPWVKHKKYNEILADLYDKALDIEPTLMSHARLNSITDCGEILIYGETADKKRKLTQASFCRDRLCPMCNWRKSLKMYQQVGAIVDLVETWQPTRYLFVTLTIRNVTGKELSDAIDKLNKGFKRLIDGSKHHAKSKKFREYLLGYMKSIEITYNRRTDTYHPHIHAIIAVRPSYFRAGYLTKIDWAEMWGDAMDLDYAPSIDVQAISPDEQKKAVAEIAKYPIKSADVLEIDDEEQAVDVVITLRKAMHGRRLVTYGKQFRDAAKKLKLQDVEKADLIHIDEDEAGEHYVVQYLFRWRPKIGLYIC